MKGAESVVVHLAMHDLIDGLEEEIFLVRGLVLPLTSYLSPMNQICFLKCSTA